MPKEMLELLEKTGIFCIADSVEAVCFGETLSSKMHTEIAVKEKISKQAQQAIRIRYKPLNEVKNSFVQFYFSSADKSNKSEIARKFYRSLNEDQQRVLTPSLKTENASRTLIRHINRLLNSNDP